MSAYSTRLPVGNRDFTQATVVIIGAGISGICMAIDLIKRNQCRNFIILEKSSSVGGTWNDNKYPGCCCDVWSVLYSYSFEQNPNWSREYPGQEELHAYLVGIAEKYGLYKHIRFNSTVEEARWDDTEFKWKTTVKVSGDRDGESLSSYSISSSFLVSAVGQLNLPREPNIAGLKEFGGKMMHSARWDWSYDLMGKRIAIIGNGATAAQIVPEIAADAAHLTVFQRTPNWVIPRMDVPVSKLQQTLLKYIPPIRWRKRALAMDFREDFHDAIFDNDSQYARGIRDTTPKLLRAQLANKPELWDTLTPDYAPGCKRVIISDDYFPTLGRDNVSLETRSIVRITEKGIEVEGDGEQEYDLIILATGFQTVDFIHPVQVFGANGRPLSDIWKDGAKAYKGVTVEDLPNFGMFYGPNTNLGHSSIILMIEAQSRYINTLVGEVIRAKERGQMLSLIPTPKAMKEFNDRIQELLRSSSFGDPNCNSWYKRDDGLITNNWSGRVIEYQDELSQVQWEDYLAHGPGKDLLFDKKPTHIGRVREETYFSNASLIGALGAVTIVGGFLWARPRLQRSR